jgi:hypothetical protein
MAGAASFAALEAELDRRQAAAAAVREARLGPLSTD